MKVINLETDREVARSEVRDVGVGEVCVFLYDWNGHLSLTFPEMYFPDGLSQFCTNNKGTKPVALVTNDCDLDSELGISSPVVARSVIGFGSYVVFGEMVTDALVCHYFQVRHIGVRDSFVRLEAEKISVVGGSKKGNGNFFNPSYNHLKCTLENMVQLNSSPSPFGNNERRVISTGLFIREFSNLISYSGRSRLGLLKRTSIKTGEENNPVGGMFVRYFTNKKNFNDNYQIVDGRQVSGVSEKDLLHPKAQKLLKNKHEGSNLFVMKTTTGFDFIGVASPHGDYYGICKDHNGISSILLHGTQMKYIRLISDLGVID